MYLGVDCGTSALKAVLVDERERLRRFAHGYLPDHPAPAGPNRILTTGALRCSTPSPRWRARAAGGDGRGGGDRLFRADAQRRAARRRGPAVAPGDPAQRRARLARGARTGRASSRAGVRHRRQADGRLHRAEAALDAPPRARGFRADRLRAAAQGLSAPQPDRRTAHRHERRGGNVVARRGAPPWSRRRADGERRRRGCGAAARRRFGRGRLAARRGRRSFRPAARRGGRRRRRRRGGRGCWNRRGGARRGVRFARHGGAVDRGDRRLSSRRPNVWSTISRMLCRGVGTAWRRC